MVETKKSFDGRKARVLEQHGLNIDESREDGSIVDRKRIEMHRCVGG